MKTSMELELREAPHGLLRVRSWSDDMDEPCVRYLARVTDHAESEGIIRLDQQKLEPVCKIGDLEIHVHAYADRLEIRLVSAENVAAKSSVAGNLVEVA